MRVRVLVCVSLRERERERERENEMENNMLCLLSVLSHLEATVWKKTLIPIFISFFVQSFGAAEFLTDVAGVAATQTDGSVQFSDKNLPRSAAEKLLRLRRESSASTSIHEKNFYYVSSRLHSFK